MDTEVQLGTTPEELVENFAKSETRFSAYMALNELGTDALGAIHEPGDLASQLPTRSFSQSPLAAYRSSRRRRSRVPPRCGGEKGSISHV